MRSSGIVSLCSLNRKLCDKVTKISVRSLGSGPDQILPAVDHRAWSPDTPVTIRMTETGPQSRKPISLPTLLRHTTERAANRRALETRDGRHWSYSQYLEDVRTASKAFISLGLEPFHTVSVLGYPDPCQHIANMAAIHAGGFVGGMYQTNTEEACKYIATDSRANVIVVSDQTQLDKILSIRNDLPELKAIVLFDDFDGQVSHPGVLTWKQLMEIGKDQTDSCLDERLRNIAVNQCCTLGYTSGTTGNPKGTMLSHDNLTWTALQNTDFFKWEFGEEKVLSYLPQNHMAGMMMDQCMIMSVGGICCFADKNALKGTLLDNFQHFRPTRVMGVTRIFEKIEDGIKKKGADTKGLKRKIVDWAKSQALNHHKQEESGKVHSSLGYTIGKKLLRNVHEALGLDQAQKHGFAIGAAAVSPETVRFFLSLDMKLLEMISQTEITAFIQLSNTPEPGEFRIGRVGLEFKDQCEVKLINKDETGAGEMLCRSRAVCMGYLNSKEKTLETIDDDCWLHSGDLLRADQEGFYKVVGRIKEIIIPAGGENVAPTNIEDEIKISLPDAVSNVMVCGDGKQYLTCLLTLKVDVDLETQIPTENLEERSKAWIKSVCGKEFTTVSEALSSPEWSNVEKAIEDGIEKANSKAISNVARIKKFKVLRKDFSVDGGELSPTLKLKRSVVSQMYADTIEEMYSE